MVNGLYIGQNALLINQAALTVVSNNIANANTEGYSKQRVNLTSMVSHAPVANAFQQAKLGYGVELESISRYRDSFVDANYRSSVASKTYFETLNTHALTMESLANEFTGSGLSTNLNSFFSAANNLSLYPTDVTMKTDFVQQATNTAAAMNELYNKLYNARTELVGDPNDIASINNSQLKFCVDDINQKLQELADVNRMVIYQHSTSAGAPAGLLDQRDAILDDLAQYIPITIEENVNGGINVFVDNVQIVGGADVCGEFKINIGDNDNPAIISFEDDNYVYSSNMQDKIGNSGKLGAILTLGGNSNTEVTIKSMMDNLNTLTTEFANQLNAIQLKFEAGPPAMASAYYNPTTDSLQISTEPLFVTNDGSGVITAGNIVVNENIAENPFLVATAYVEVEVDAVGYMSIKEPDAIGNNSAAQAMVDLRLDKIAGLNNQTFEAFNTTITTDFASKIGSVQSNMEAAESIYNAAFEQRESTIGVNIEEELVDLVKYQRAYESSARIFTVSNEILQTLVNLGR